MLELTANRIEMGSTSSSFLLENERVDTMRINDEMLDKLGTYFVYHEVYNRYGITFESFVDRWSRGIIDI
ncbi:hypothetical protein [Solibacillus cecembensis]|uniref:hypothetical protein n=1 Tax=Solibacillus cecembensis TaxID=459347 RepID=UPI003D05F7A1